MSWGKAGPFLDWSPICDCIPIDDENAQQILNLHQKGILSTQGLLDAFGFDLDWDTEVKKIREEHAKFGDKHAPQILSMPGNI